MPDNLNILWITTDHQQWRTIAGRSICRTPNIDRIAGNGLLFNRSYTPMPVCCPVRAMWHSGAYPWHNGVHTQVHSTPSLTRDMYPDVVTYSQRLREAGYRQGFVGKWHASYLRTPLDFGFDEVCALSGCSRESMARIAGRVTPEPPVPKGEVKVPPGRLFQWPGSEPFPMWVVHDTPLEMLHTTRLGNAAVEMLGRYAAAGQPWHLAVHFPEPHDAYSPHRSYLERYPPDEMPVPASFADTFAGKPGMHRRESETWGELTERDVREGTAHFFAYCQQIDDQVGRILDALEASGQADRTVVAFATDHGDMLGAHRMWIKSWMPYEEVYRVPMILSVPGAGRARATDHLVQTHDLVHTFLELAGAAPLPYRDGRSLLPLLQSPARPDWEDAVLCASYGCEIFVTQRMVVTERYKYVWNGFDIDELYDLREDPGEMHNLIADESRAGARAELRGKLYELMNRFGDPYGDVGPGRPYADAPNRYGAPRYLPRA